MSRIIFTIAFLIFGSVQAATVNVTLKDISSSKGNIRLAIFNKANAAKFPSDPTGQLMIADKTGKLVEGIIEPAKEGDMNFSIELPAGTYAITAYQDENNNGELDTNFFGAPTENYGFSNDARGVFSAPYFEEAQFIIGNETLNLSFYVE